MRTEIDLPNSNNELRDGMFGRVTIHLTHAAGGVKVPSQCLVSSGEGKKFHVYVVRDGHARRMPVEVGHDDGRQVEVLSGIGADDFVVRRPGNDLADGAEVAAEEVPDSLEPDKH